MSREYVVSKTTSFPSPTRWCIHCSLSLQTAQFVSGTIIFTVADESALGLKCDMVIPVRREDTEMTPSISTPEREPLDKAILYCPECSYESRINDDWLIHVLADSHTYECPDCGAMMPARIKKH